MLLVYVHILLVYVVLRYLKLLVYVAFADHIRSSSKNGQTYNLCQKADWTGECGDQKRDTCFSHPECYVGRSPPYHIQCLIFLNLSQDT